MSIGYGIWEAYQNDTGTSQTWQIDIDVECYLAKWSARSRTLILQ